MSIDRLKTILYNSFVMLSESYCFDENFLTIELGLSTEEINELKQDEDIKELIVED